MALSLVSASRAAAAPVPAVAGYGGCLLAQKSGDLLILFDESKSINDHDQENARVTAASYLVRQMLLYSRQNDVKLDVAVAGFADSYRQPTPWIRLDPNGAEAVQETISSFKNPTSGFETDYWSALTGAKDALVKQAGGNADRCQAVVWFSDGGFSLTKRNSSTARQYGERKPYASEVDLRDKGATGRAEAKAVEDICRPEGVANQLRDRHITVLAIGLTHPGQQADTYTLMKQIAEAGPNCGEAQQPPGHFWRVGDIDEMLAAFDQVANPRGQQTREFVLDDALNRVHIFGSGQAGLIYTLVAPDGKRLVLKKTSTTTSQRATIFARGVDVSWEWLSDQTLTVDLTRVSGKPWTGLWSVDIVDPNGKQGPKPTISLSGDLYPAWPSSKNAAKLRSGDQPMVQLGLAGVDGKPILAQDLLGRASLTATLITPDGKAQKFADQLDKNQIFQSQPLDLREAPVGAATVRLELTYITAKVGNKSTTLEPQQVDVPVEILAPPDSGHLDGTFDFGSSDRALDVADSIQVEGPSCVWMTGAAPVVTSRPPDNIDPLAITSDHNSAATCLKVPAGQTAPLEARLRTEAAGNGSLVGTVEVMQAPIDEPERATAVQVPFGAEMKKPLKLLNFALALIVALILGPGIPLGLLYLAKFWTARIPGRPLEALRFPVTVDGERLLSDGQPLNLATLPRAQAVDLLQRGSRTANAAGVPLRTRTGRSPFGPGFVEASLPGAAGVSSSHAQASGKSNAARLPLAVHNTWAAFVDPAGPAASATVLLLRGLDVTNEQRREQLNDVQDRLPALLRDFAPAGPPSPGEDPSSGAATAPGTDYGTSTPPKSSDPAPDFDFGFGDDGTT